MPSPSVSVSLQYLQIFSSTVESTPSHLYPGPTMRGRRLAISAHVAFDYVRPTLLDADFELLHRVFFGFHGVQNFPKTKFASYNIKNPVSRNNYALSVLGF